MYLTHTFFFNQAFSDSGGGEIGIGKESVTVQEKPPYDCHGTFDHFAWISPPVREVSIRLQFVVSCVPHPIQNESSPGAFLKNYVYLVYSFCGSNGHIVSPEIFDILDISMDHRKKSFLEEISFEVPVSPPYSLVKRSETNFFTSE